MFKPLFISRTIAVLCLALVCSVSEAAETTNQVKMADVPAVVQKAIHAQVGKGRVNSIQKITDDREVTYEVEMRKNNRARSFTVGENGELLDIEVFIGETPLPVQAAIKKEVGGGSIESIDKVFDDGDVSYEVEMNRDGKMRTFTVDETGKLESMQAFFNETPAAVQKTILKELGGAKLGDVTEIFEDGEMNYQVEINPDGKSRLVSIDPKGTMVSQSQSIDLAAAPAAVQTAIKGLLKDGKLGSVSKITEDGEVSYEVEIKREGKTESVTIETDGKVSP